MAIMADKISRSSRQVELSDNPKPLTRRNRQGEFYTRTKEVEAEIKDALILDWPTLITRARISDKSSPKYLQEESLVYFIQKALTLKEEDAFRNLFQILHNRCAGYIRSHFRSFSLDKQEDAFQNVIEHLVDKIMNLKNDSSDFFQVRFWFGLKRIMITEYGNQLEEIEDDEKLVSIDEQITGTEGPGPMLEIPSHLISPEELTMLKAGLSSIRDPYRKVFILRYYGGWPIKSNDPAEVTISSRFGVTPRTIQNWLDVAENSLTKYRKEMKK
jgi:RNA polymerase sigma factor (sigma-70 family)